MTEPQASTAPTPRWPGVVGTIGIVLAVLMFIDKADDLLFMPLLKSQGFWKSFLGDDMAGFLARAMPPTAWLIVSSLVGMGLASLLFLGSLRLRRLRRSGIKLCRTWGWIAIAWVVIEFSAAFRWLGAWGDELAEMAGTGWEGPAAFGILLAMAILLAFPVFLLVWLSREPVQTYSLSWQD